MLLGGATVSALVDCVANKFMCGWVWVLIKEVPYFWYIMTVFLLCPDISLSSHLLLSQAAGTAVLGTLDDVMMSPVNFSQLGIPSIPHPAQSHTSFHSFRLPGILQQSLQLTFPQGCGKHNNLVRCKSKNTATWQ